MTSAYDRSYLYRAQKSLGRMLDFAVHEMGFETEAFWTLFLESGVADGFGRGESRLLAGMSGIELAYEVLDRTKTKYRRVKNPVCGDEKGPEYWAAWALAHYQWLRGLAFAEIDLIAPIKVVVGMYSPYHEMSLKQFCARMDELYAAANKEPRLRRLRTAARLSQSELAERAGMSIRTLQHYEQGSKDIRRAAGETLLALSRALGTTIENLLA